MKLISLIAGLLLPWLIGLALVLAMQSPRRPLAAPGEVAWILGAGYLVGAFALTLWMRALSRVGLMFSGVNIALPLIVGSAVLFFFSWRRHRHAIADAVKKGARALFVPAELGGVGLVAWRLAVAWLVLRFALFALEIAWQPLYPWDAWIQWATKARVWYELGHLAPFARTDAWFAANGAYFFDASPEYPATVPLLQVWACIALGRWDDTLMNWPWWQIAASLTLATYGGLRSLGVGTLSSIAGAFFVATLPLANAHVALAGYADLPLAAFYAAAALAFLRWQQTRDWRDACLLLLLALACTQIKNPGIFWAATLVPGAAIVIWPRHAIKLVVAAFGGALCLLLVLAHTEVTVFNYRLHLNFNPAWGALGESFFVLGNWHLLWYGVIVVGILAWRELYKPALAPLTAIIASGTLFLFIVFGFTDARAWVEEQTTVNRATLHFAPLIAIYLVLVFHAFAKRWRETHAAAKEVPPMPSAAASGAR
jgi:hypothetical protein